MTLYPLILPVVGLGVPARIAFGTLHRIVPIAIFAMNAIGLHDVPTIMATIVLLGIVAVSASALLLWLDRRLHHRVA